MDDAAEVTEELKRTLAQQEGGRRWLRRALGSAALALVIAGGLVWRAKHAPPPPAKYITQTATVGDVAEKVQATGAVQPVLQVNVGAQVNGRVERVYVDFNSLVKKGDVLAEIDPTIYGSQASEAQANLATQRAQMAAAKASEDMARVTFERTERLFTQHLASRGELDIAKGQWDVAKAQALQSQAAIGVTEATLARMKTNVAFTKIYSPVDGVVINRAIDPGATVVASFQSATLFVIAKDLRKMRVLADVDEADVGKLKEHMEAEAVVDAFPGEVFRGTVQQVRYSPNTVQGVVTYSAVVEVDNPEEKLRPGMTATVTVKTNEVKGVTRLPNAALRYKPTPPLGPDGKPKTPPPEPPLVKGTGRIYVLSSEGKPGEEKIEPTMLSVGITDGVFTEIKGGLPAEAKVVTDETDVDDKKKKGKLF